MVRLHMCVLCQTQLFPSWLCRRRRVDLTCLDGHHYSPHTPVSAVVVWHRQHKTRIYQPKRHSNLFLSKRLQKILRFLLGPSVLLHIRMYTKGVWQSSEEEEEETHESSSSPASGPPFKESKNEHILLWRPCANETDDGDDRH